MSSIANAYGASATLIRRKVPRMTRGHYIFIADALSEMADSYGIPKGSIATGFARRLKATNSDFDSARFISRVINGAPEPKVRNRKKRTTNGNEANLAFHV